ncbi:sensor domain-containing protein [Nonomuraea rhodomycinica]|uniref:Sensor domain-containing protein n=1 Tax=Nonomuraea rhodomycinica TaxID=1712872 RepID=A0A7Y6ISV4_9ACTN|nr:sensor domain-containing protein [Nonomuraea rhodomycinica]NUW43796.1 sensor domain-containing protein [Nonomuraea rhodomycinica]
MTNLRHRIATDTRYTFMGLPASIASFGLVVAGVAAGLGGAVAVVGLPVLAGTAVLARGFAESERESLADVLRRPVGRPEYAGPPADAGRWRRTLNPLAGPQAWLDLLHAVVALPFAVVAFVITTVWWAGAVAGLTFPLYGWIIAGIPGVDGGLPQLLGLGTGTATFVMFNTAVGALFALTLAPAVRTAALLRAVPAQLLLARPVAESPYDPHVYGAAQPAFRAAARL